MRIGVVSDTHDRQEAVAEAVRLLMEQHVELILHCGDIESPEIASRSDTRGSESRSVDSRSGCENVAADADDCARSQRPTRRLANCL